MIQFITQHCIHHTSILKNTHTNVLILINVNQAAPFFTSLLFATSFPFRLFEEHGELLGLFNKFRELKTKEQQASSEELGEHANKVMETLDEGIRSLDELDTFFGFLHQVGASHTRIPDFKSEYFWVSSSLSLSGLFIYDAELQSDPLFQTFSSWISNENSLFLYTNILLQMEQQIGTIFFSSSLFIPFRQKIEKPFLSAVQTTLGDRYTENVEGIYKLTIKFIIETLVTGFESANSKSNTSAVNNNSNSTSAPKSWK